jgi:hypothetical protein
MTRSICKKLEEVVISRFCNDYLVKQVFRTPPGGNQVEIKMTLYKTEEEARAAYNRCLTLPDVVGEDLSKPPKNPFLTGNNTVK